MEQTAVELLKQRLIKDQQVFPIYTEYINGILYDIDNELLEIEKQQIINAHFHGCENMYSYTTGAEQYYNQTFNK
jgi:hypothetical protein